MEPARLKALPLFADLDEAQCAQIAAYVQETTVPAGETLAREGDHAYELFVVEDGEAEVRKDGEVIRTVGAGDVIGEIGLLATGTRTATVVSSTPMTLVAVFSREFAQLQRRQPQIADKLRELMRERVARTRF